MTFVQPRNKKRSFVFLALLVVIPIGAQLFFMVYLQNNAVSLKHQINRQKVELQEWEADVARLQTRLFTVINNQSLQDFAYNQGLVRETNINYMEISRQWASALQ